MKYKVKEYYNLVLIIWIVCLGFFYSLIRNLILYQTNDDFFLYGISSGTIYGKPSSDLIFITFPINHILEYLYIQIPQVNWMFELYLISMFASLLAFSLAINKNIYPNNFYKTILFLFLNTAPIFLFLKMFFYFQFSQVAIISAGLGTLIYLIGQSKFFKMYGLVLILIGFSWRSEAAILAFVLALLIFLVYVFLDKKIKDFRNMSFLVLLLFVLTIFSVKSIAFLGLAPWQSEIKNDFQKKRFDILRTYDYLPTQSARDEQKTVALELGWTENDYGLFSSYYFADEEIFSATTLDSLSKQSKISNNIEFYLDSIEAFSSLIKSQHFIIGTGVVVLLIFIGILSKNFSLASLFFTLFLYLLFMYFVYLLGKLPERIFWPLSFVFLLSIIVFFIHSKNLREFRERYLLILVFPLIFISTYPANHDYQEVLEKQWWKTVREDRKLGFDRVLSYKPDRPIIAFSSFYSPLITTIDLTENEPNEIFTKMIYINWTVGSEEFENHIERLNIDRNLFTSIAKQEAYLAISRIEELQMVDRYLRQHHKIRPIWDSAPFVFNDTGLEIWRIIGIR